MLGCSPMNTNAAAAGTGSGLAGDRGRGPRPRRTGLFALEFDDVHAGVDGELRIGPDPFLQDGRGRQARAGQHPDTVGELGQVEPFFQGRVAAADDDDLVGALVERAVAGRAEVDAGADQLSSPGTPRRR